MARVPARGVRKDNQVALGRPGIDSSVSDALTTASALAGDIGEGAAKVYGAIKRRDDESEEITGWLKWTDRRNRRLTETDGKISSLDADAFADKTAEEVAADIEQELFTGLSVEDINDIHSDGARDRVKSYFDGNTEQIRGGILDAVKARKSSLDSADLQVRIQGVESEPVGSLAEGIEKLDRIDFMYTGGHAAKLPRFEDAARVEAARNDSHRRAAETVLATRVNDNPSAFLREIKDGETEARYARVVGTDYISRAKSQAVQGVARQTRAAHLSAQQNISRIQVDSPSVGSGYTTLISRRGSRINAFEAAQDQLDRLLPYASARDQGELLIHMSDLQAEYERADQRDRQEMALYEVGAAALNNPNFALNPNDKGQVEAAELSLSQFVIDPARQMLAAGDDPEEVAQFVARKSASLGVAPPALGRFMEGLAASNDPRSYLTGVRTLDLIQSNNPRVFKQLPDETVMKFSAFRVLADVKNDEQVALDIAVQMSSGTMRDEESNAYLQDYSARFAGDESMGENIGETVQGLVSQYFRDDPGSVPPAMIQDFSTLVQMNYATIRSSEAIDPAVRFKTAQSMAAAQLQQAWGISRIGGKNIWMKNAPEMEHGLSTKDLDGNRSWQAEHLSTFMKSAAARPDDFDVDSVEIFEWPDRINGKAAYAVFQRHDDGTVTQVTAKDSAGPVIWQPDWDEAAENQVTQQRAGLLRAEEVTDEQLETFVDTVQRTEGDGFGIVNRGAQIRDEVTREREAFRREQRARLEAQQARQANRMREFTADPRNAAAIQAEADRLGGQ